MDKFSEETRQVFIGSTLGDGYLGKSGTNCYFEEIHSIKQKEYLSWKKKYMPNSKLSERTCHNYKLGREYKQIRLRAATNPQLTKLHALFYGKGKKKVPVPLLTELNELGLTVWYLDDGHVGILSDLANISTDSFSLDENYLIKKIFEKKWNIIPQVSKRKNKYYLTFNRVASDKLLGIISETFKKYCLPESMKYKLGKLWHGNTERIEKEKIKINKYKRKWRANKRKLRLKEREKQEKKRLEQVKELYFEKEKSLYEVAHLLGYKSHVTILKILKNARIKRRSLSEACLGEKNGFFGKKHTEKTRKIISKAKKKVAK